jgi:putative flippase GtrA
MTRLAALLWVIGGAALAGVFIMVVLMIPSLQFEAPKYILIAAITGFVVAVPLSFVAAKAITERRAS